MVFSRIKRTGLSGSAEKQESQIESTGSEISRAAAEKSAMTNRRISEILRRAADDISATESRSYPEMIRESVSMAREKVDESTEVVKTNIREHPMASVAMAVGMGFLAGAAISLLGSRVYYEYRD